MLLQNKILNKIYRNNYRKYKPILATLNNNLGIKIFKDDKANNKILALTTSQMLSSIATLIHDSYLPIYMSEVIGLSNVKIGAIQGISQFLCQFTKGISGVVGDILKSQEKVLLFGMILTLLCKPMFIMLENVNMCFGATFTMYWYFIAKFMDRISKGIREAPSKAIINEQAKISNEKPDVAYGFRHSLATFGALIGTGIAGLVFSLTNQNYIITFMCSMVPPLISLIWLSYAFKDDIVKNKINYQEKNNKNNKNNEMKLFEKVKKLVKLFKKEYWMSLFVVSILYFARFDASFVTLRAKEIMSKQTIPFIFMTSSIIQAILSAPISKIAIKNKTYRNIILNIGIFSMMIANYLFASTNYLYLGAIFLGLHMSMTHSLTISMLSSNMPTGEIEGIGKISGSVVSFTDCILGIVLIFSNILAGVLSDITKNNMLGNTGSFYGGFTACLISIIVFNIFNKYFDL